MILFHFLDLANPKGNLKTAGFTKEERDSFTTLLEENKFVDSFRELYPEMKDAYSYWSYHFNARAKDGKWSSLNLALEIYTHYTWTDK